MSNPTRLAYSFCGERMYPESEVAQLRAERDAAISVLRRIQIVTNVPFGGRWWCPDCKAAQGAHLASCGLAACLLGMKP